MAKRVLLLTADLVFRAKLAGVVAAAGGVVTRNEVTCDLAVIELAGPGASRLSELARRGVPVLAFGSHVQPELLRAARDTGATAVPNSQVERTLRDWLNA